MVSDYKKLYVLFVPHALRNELLKEVDTAVSVYKLLSIPRNDRNTGTKNV